VLVVFLSNLRAKPDQTEKIRHIIPIILNFLSKRKEGRPDPASIEKDQVGVKYNSAASCHTYNPLLLKEANPVFPAL